MRFPCVTQVNHETNVLLMALAWVDAGKPGMVGACPKCVAYYPNEAADVDTWVQWELPEAFLKPVRVSCLSFGVACRSLENAALTWVVHCVCVCVCVCL